MISQASEREEVIKKWVLSKSKKTYQVGISEWDSSTYTPFNLIGWLNLYDFAEDKKVKNAAQAMLDYYASMMALKYTHGVYGGAEQRGGGALASFQSYADYLSWLWFSDYIPKNSSFFQWPSYIQTIYAATSSYRPPQEAVALASKKSDQKAYYKNAKAYYHLERLEIPEFFYINRTYTLGTALLSKGDQSINWKLVSYPEKEKNTGVVTGGNSIDNSDRNGVGKTIFDKYIQQENILIQMTYVPAQLKSDFYRQKLRNLLKHFIKINPCGNSCRFLLEQKLERLIPLAVYPVKNSNDDYWTGNYISYPQGAETKVKDGKYFLRLNKTYLAISPFPNQKISHQVATEKNRQYIENQVPLGKLAGFIMEVGNQYEQKSFVEFQDLIAKKTHLDTSKINSGKITYRSADGTLIDVDYQFQKTLPDWSVNNNPINLNSLIHKLYDGPQLQISNRILRIEGPDTTYEVDYQGAIPIFKRVPK
jgi:hypothetical protein